MKALRVLLIIGVAAALVTGLTCSNDSPVDTTGGNNGTGANDDEFNLATVQAALETMDAAEALYLGVMAGGDMQAAADAALANLTAQPTVAYAQVGPDSTVWALFTNGLMAGISELDRNPGGKLRADRVTEDILDAKGGGESIGQAVVLTPFAHDWGNASELQVADMLDDCYGSIDDGTTVYSDNQVTVARVKEVLTAGPGVLLWSSHGCVVPVDATGTPWVVLLTGEGYASRQMAEKIVNNYSGGASGKGWNRELVVVAHKGTHWLAVTPTFVTNHGNFDYLEGMDYNGSKSVVYACCCYSGAELGQMPYAFIGVGVDCYLGWTQSVNVGFASTTQISFFESATDTYTIKEALAEVGSVTDPWKGAQLLLHDVEIMMIRSQMTMKKDGGDQHGYAVGVVVDDVTMVNCFAGQPKQIPQYGVTVHFPGAGPGSWNCQTDEGALIAVTELMTGRLFLVQKDYKGVTGTVDVETYDEDVISGTFNGTIGYWSPGQNPEEDPPSSTVSIEDGIFKHVGLRQ